MKYLHLVLSLMFTLCCVLNSAETPEKIIGYWKYDSFKKFVVNNYDMPLPSSVKSVGKYEITARWEGGPHMIKVMGVQVLSEGKVISEDSNSAIIGPGKNQYHQFTITVPKEALAGEIVIRAQIKYLVGTRTRGRITLKAADSQHGG